MNRKILYTEHSDEYPAASAILAFINQEFADIAELDSDLIDLNLLYGSSSGYKDGTCWELRKERIDYLIDNLSVFKCALIIDPEFRAFVAESIRTIGKLFEKDELSKIRHPIFDFEEYYTVDFDALDEDDIDPFIDRMRFSYASHPEIHPMLLDLNEDIAALDYNDMRNIGIIASSFMYLLIAFEISDLLYLSLKNRVDFSRKAYIDEYKNHLDNSID